MSTSQMLQHNDLIANVMENSVIFQAVVGQLIENSSTYQNKTGYAQEKWVKKKKKK